MNFCAEVFLEIFHYLEKKDLKTVRLVSQSFHGAASKLLFDTVHISAHEEDFKVFKNVAKHPQISTYIRCLKYDGSSFSTGLSRRDYVWQLGKQILYHHHRTYYHAANSPDPDVNNFVSHIRNRNKRWLPTDEDKDDLFGKYGESHFIVEGYTKFMKHAHWQKASRVAGMEYWPLVYATLGSFPNLVSIKSEDGWFSGRYSRSADSTVNHTSFGGFLEVGTPLRRSWNPFHLTPTWCSNFQRTWLQSPESMDAIANFDTMTSLLQNTAKPVTDLIIAFAFLPARALSAEMVGDRLSSFAGLRSLFLKIDSDGPSYNPLVGLPKILEVASGLKYLVVSHHEGLPFTLCGAVDFGTVVLIVQHQIKDGYADNFFCHSSFYQKMMMSIQCKHTHSKMCFQQRL